MIAQALRRQVKALAYRHFSSQEPAVPHYISAQRTIQGTVGVLASQHPAEWAQLGIDFQKQLDYGMPLRASQEPLALGAEQPAALGVVQPQLIQRVYQPVINKLPTIDVRKSVSNKVQACYCFCLFMCHFFILIRSGSLRFLIMNCY